MGEKSMINVITQFLNNAFFSQGTITIQPKHFYYDQGTLVETLGTSYIVKARKVLVPVNTRDLKQVGMGEYTADETFSLFVDKPLNYVNGTALQQGDVITYDSTSYKLVSSLNFKTHGFYKYLISKLKTDTLDD